MTEEQLAIRLKQGDNLARKALYERFGGRLLALCHRYVGNREEAEDVMHDAFILVFERIQKFDYKGEGSLSAWLTRVFTNYTLSYLSRERRWATEDAEVIPDMADDDPPPTQIETREIMRFIAELPTGYRTVLNLYLIEGWSHAEIAAQLHIKESTSASQYLRAKKLLQQKITDYLKQNDQ